MPEIDKLLKNIADCAQALSDGELLLESAEERYAELEKLCADMENGSQSKSKTYLTPLLYYNNRENLFKLTVVFKKSQIGFIPMDYAGEDKYIPLASDLIGRHFSAIKDKGLMQFASSEKKLKVFTSYAPGRNYKYIIAAVQSVELEGLEAFKDFSNRLSLRIKAGSPQPPVSLDYCRELREGAKSFLETGLASGLKMKASVFTLASLHNIFNYAGLKTLTMIADDTLHTLQRYFSINAMVIIITSEIYLAIFPQQKEEAQDKKKLSFVYDNILLKHVRSDFILDGVEDLNPVWAEIEKHMFEDDV